MLKRKRTLHQGTSALPVKKCTSVANDTPATEEDVVTYLRDKGPTPMTTLCATFPAPLVQTLLVKQVLFSKQLSTNTASDGILHITWASPHDAQAHGKGHAKQNSFRFSNDQLKTAPNSIATDTPEKSVGELKEEYHTLVAKLASLKEDKVKVDAHIQALHDYNDIKDITQELMGRLAEIEALRTRDMYPRFGLDIED